MSAFVFIPKDPDKHFRKGNLERAARPSQIYNPETRLEYLAALEFEMALYYAQSWHGDLSNAIIKAEQAYAHQLQLLKMRGVTDPSNDRSLQPFLKLLIAVYKLDNDTVRQKERGAFTSEIKNINFAIAAAYTAKYQQIFGTEDPGLTFPVESIANQYMDTNLIGKVNKDPNENPQDTAKKDRVRATLKQELVNKYYRGLGLDMQGMSAAEVFGPWEAAAIELELALAFLEQPDYSNAIIHAETAKAMLLQLLSEPLHPGMREVYDALLFIYQRIPNQEKYAADIAIYQELQSMLPHVSSAAKLVI